MAYPRLPELLGSLKVYAFFFQCNSCGHRKVVTLEKAIDFWGAGARIVDLERRARCKCGARRASIQTERRSWR